MVELLSSDNLALREKLENMQSKMNNLQMVRNKKNTWMDEKKNDTTRERKFVDKILVPCIIFFATRVFNRLVSFVVEEKKNVHIGLQVRPGKISSAI